MRVNRGELLDVRGTLDVQSGTLSVADGQVTRSWLAQDALAPLAIPLTELRVWDALGTLLPGTAANDDLAIITGTFGTDAARVRTSDAKASSVTQRGRVLIPLPPDYDAGETLTLRVRAGMITTVADTSATVDVECYVEDADGAVGSDICATAAQSINSTDKANKDFTITPTGLAPGDVLDVRLTVAIVDSATGTAVIGEISRLALLYDRR